MLFGFQNHDKKVVSVPRNRIIVENRSLTKQILETNNEFIGKLDPI